MNIIIETGGKQYIVNESLVLDIEKIDAEVNSEIIIDKVLLVTKDNKTDIGTPYLKQQAIFKVLEQNRADKKTIFKFKPKTGYKLKKGHRQYHTRIKFVKLTDKK